MRGKFTLQLRTTPITRRIRQPAKSTPKKSQQEQQGTVRRRIGRQRGRRNYRRASLLRTGKMQRNRQAQGLHTASRPVHAIPGVMVYSQRRLRSGADEARKTGRSLTICISASSTITNLWG